MNYRQNYFSTMGMPREYYGYWDNRYERMPYYMTCPMPEVYSEEAEYERDMDRMKQMYPDTARIIQKYVDEECDKMEYDGSLMFDEYPDRIMLAKICGRIFERVKDHPSMEGVAMDGTGLGGIAMESQDSEEEVSAMNCGNRGGGCGRNIIRDLVDVLLFNEMHKRRCRYKRCRRWW